MVLAGEVVVVVTWMVVDIIVREDMLPIFVAPEVEDIQMDMDVAEEMRLLAATTSITIAITILERHRGWVLELEMQEPLPLVADMFLT